MQRLGRISIAGMLLLTTFLSLSPMRAVRASVAPDFESGQVVVKLAPLVNTGILAINLAYGTTTIAPLFNHDDTFLLLTPPNVSAVQLVQMMAGDPRLAYAELNYVNEDPEDGSTDRVYGWGTDGTAWHNQDATRAMRLQSAHNINLGEGVMVAVLDTGVQLDHPALAGRLGTLGYDFVDNDLTPEDEANGLDDDVDGRVDEAYGHGTHVTGIVLMVAPQALILPLRVLNSDGRGNNFRTANAVLYAAYSGADVINLSLGTAQPSALLRDAVDEAAAQGVVVVAAAGNLNSNARQYPAAEACALAITSVSDQGRKSSFANYGHWIDVAAPGEDIYSTFPVNGYAWWSGTSMSTPFVAGQAALLRSVASWLTLGEIGLLIGGTAQSVDHMNPFYRGLLGEGEIDILASLEYQAAGTWPAPEHNLLASCTN